MTNQDLAARIIQVGGERDPKELFPVVVPEARDLVWEDPFAFAMATCLDRGTKADIIWTIPYDMRNKLGHLDPAKLAALSLEDLADLLGSLPRRPRYTNDAPRTVKDIATIVSREYAGQAAQIWEGKTAASVRSVFRRVHGVGEGIASMAVLLLERAFGVEFDDADHRDSDIKPDVHTMRVLCRLGVATERSETAAVQAARRLHPEYPGALDSGLWWVGRNWCSENDPDCPSCPLDSVCPKLDLPPQQPKADRSCRH